MYSHWQTTGSYTKQQGTPSRQCNNNWKMYPNGAKTLDLDQSKQSTDTVVERTNNLRYLRVHLDRMLIYRQHVETTALKCKKGLSVLKDMAAKGIEHRHLFLLYQSVVLSDYGLGLTNNLKLYRVQNEAMSHTGTHQGHTH